MFSFDDPLDVNDEYGLNLYKYQRTAALITLILNDFYWHIDSPDRLDELPDIIRRHKREVNEFMNREDYDKLIEKYKALCEDEDFVSYFIELALNGSN